MILKHEYLDDLKEYIRETPDAYFTRVGLTKQSVLSDEDCMEDLWILYQKFVEDYDCDPRLSAWDALHERLGIQMDSQTPEPGDIYIGKDPWVVLQVEGIKYPDPELFSADAELREQLAVVVCKNWETDTQVCCGYLGFYQYPLIKVESGMDTSALDYFVDFSRRKHREEELIEILKSKGMNVPDSLMEDTLREVRALESELSEAGVPVSVQTKALSAILRVINDFDFRVGVVIESGKETAFEIEDWTPNGVDMIHYVNLEECGYNPYGLLEAISAVANDFDPDEEVALCMQGEAFRSNFSYSDAAEEFNQWKRHLEELSKYVKTRLFRLVPELDEADPESFVDNLSYKLIWEGKED